MPPPPTPPTTYQVLAYHLPHNSPNALITCNISLTPSSWSIDLQSAFPDGINTDIHFLRGPSTSAPSCFCGQRQETAGDDDKNDNDEWDQHWSCTAVCKLRRRYKNYMREKEQGNRGGRDIGGGGVEYVLFVEADGYDAASEVPLLERVWSFEDEVPVWQRRIVMVRVEGWVPVDVKPVVVDGLKIRDLWEDEMVYLKQFLKGICSDESAWEGRFPQEESCELESGGPVIWDHEKPLYEYV